MGGRVSRGERCRGSRLKGGVGTEVAVGAVVGGFSGGLSAHEAGEVEF
jgi:hypothetical protein